MKSQFLFLGLVNLFHQVISAPTSSSSFDLKSTLLSRSDSSSGTISILFKRHRRENGRAQVYRRDGHLGRNHSNQAIESQPRQVTLINGGFDYDILAEIEFGSPPQTLEIQLDTGSSLLMVEGPDFNSPSNTDIEQSAWVKSFDPSKSNTSSALTGNVTYSYQDNTFFRADLIQDTVSFGGYELGNAPFAVATTGNITFPPRASGILGLSFSPGNSQLQSSSNGMEVAAEEASFTIPFVEQLWRMNALKQPLFSFNMILDEHDKNATDESPGGHLLLGGVDESLYEGEIVYSSLLVDPSLSSDYPSNWRATIQGVSFNGKLLPESGFDASFDTGTSVSQLPFSIINNIMSQVNTPIYLDSSDALLGSTWYFECPDEFPISSLRITLSFGGSQFEIPFGYLVSAERVLTQEGKTICSLLPQSVPNEGDAFVIGQDLLSALYIVYRFSPPAIGMAKLSSKARSEDPLPSDLKDISISSSTSYDYGSPTSPVLYTPTPNPAGSSFSTVDNPTLYWDPTTTHLPLEPTLLGASSSLSSALTPKVVQDGSRSAGDKSGSGKSQKLSCSAVSFGLAIVISVLLAPMFVF